MAHQRKIEYVTQLKKAYSTISNGIKRAMVQDGVTKLEDTVLFSKAPADGEDNSEFLAEFSKIFQVSRAYGQNEIIGQEPHEDLVQYKYLRQNKFTLNIIPTNAISALIILNDGSMIYPLFNIDGTGLIMVDVNGAKKPNEWGRDVFAFDIENNGKIIPAGMGEQGWKTNAAELSISCLNSCTNCGTGCAARIMEEGWEMNY